MLNERWDAVQCDQRLLWSTSCSCAGVRPAKCGKSKEVWGAAAAAAVRSAREKKEEDEETHN
jgi:hypothetical protein